MKRPFFYSGVNTYLPLVKFDLTPKLFFLYIWHLCTERASQGRKAGENWFIYFLCQSDLNYFFLLMNCNLAREKKFCLDNPSRFLHFIFHQWKHMKKKKKMCETKWRKETEEINFCDGTKWKRFEEYFFFSFVTLIFPRLSRLPRQITLFHTYIFSFLIKLFLQMEK